MRRIIRKKFRKFWKSAINRRLTKYVTRFSLVIFMLAVIFCFGKIQGTNSFFMDTASVMGNTMTAGYWIPPVISVSSPSGSDIWQVGSSHNILWSAESADPAATAGMEIDLDYSCDGGANWHTIIHNTGNDGTQSWTVPADISENCKIKIGATDSHGLTNSAESNKFEISWMVVLNEFMPNPVGDDNAAMPGGEWVELYNNGNENVDVDGWYLYDAYNDHELQVTSLNSDNNKDISDSGETVVPAHGWLVVYRNGDGDFELNNTGSDIVRLFDGTIGSGAHLVDFYSYTVTNVSGDTDPNNTKGGENVLDGDKVETSEGKSWARFPDGTGPWFDPVPTPGEKNTKSLDLKRFQKYYRERCLNDGKVNEKDPVCQEKFLYEIGVLGKSVPEEDELSSAISDAIFEVSDTAEAQEIIAEQNESQTNDIEDEIDGETGKGEDIAEDTAKSDNPESTNGEENQNSENNQEEPVVTKDVEIKVTGKLDVTEDLEYKVDRKIEKVDLEGEFKDDKIEIDLSELDKVSEAGTLKIKIKDLDLPDGVKVISHESDDVVLEITVSEKKEDSQDSGKDDGKKDEVKPTTDGAVLKNDSQKKDEKDEKDDDSKDGDGDGGNNPDNSNGASE